MCIGHYGSYEEFTDKQTTVCMEEQSFMLVNSVSNLNWDMQATSSSHISSVCGLGKEMPSADATGWLARSIYQANLNLNVYSMKLDARNLQQDT